MSARLYGQVIHTPSAQAAPVGVEVLFRWAGGGPGEWFAQPGASADLARDLDRHVVAGLARVSEALRDGCTPLFLNVCPETIASHRVFRRWVDQIAEVSAGFPARPIVIELSEQSALNVSELRQRLRLVHAAGFLSALDDYPSDFHTSERLDAYQWDFVKICAHQARGRGVFPGLLVRECHQKGLGVIVERPGGKAEGRRFAHMGCLGLQGFHYSRPAPLSATLAHEKKVISHAVPRTCGAGGHAYRRLAGA